MITSPILRVSEKDLGNLLNTLEVNVASLSECLVGRGHRLELSGSNLPGLHYNLKGTGRMFVGAHAPIDLKPHTLVLLPSNTPFRIETTGAPQNSQSSTASSYGEVNRHVAGNSDPEIVLICGFFNASYGSSTDLFSTLEGPIVEQFDEKDRLEQSLKFALSELIDQEVGCGAMSAVALKQVIITILRRSLTSLNLWVERFAMLSDPQIARSFAELAAHPGSNHTVISLADTACLSRSTFMSRFTALIGQSPMAILRDLRMRQAAKQLTSGQMSVDQIARSSGYDSRSSFVKAFRKTFDCDPSEYRQRSRLDNFASSPASLCSGILSHSVDEHDAG